MVYSDTEKLEAMKLAKKKYYQTHKEEIKIKDKEYKKAKYTTDEKHRQNKLVKMKEYRDKKRQEKIDTGIEVKPRGRPKKLDSCTEVKPRGRPKKLEQGVATHPEKENVKSEIFL